MGTIAPAQRTFLPAGPVLVATQLPDSNPVKKSALDYIGKYEKAHGAGSGILVVGGDHRHHVEDGHGIGRLAVRPELLPGREIPYEIGPRRKGCRGKRQQRDEKAGQPAHRTLH